MHATPCDRASHGSAVAPRLGSVTRLGCGPSRTALGLCGPARARRLGPAPHTDTGPKEWVSSRLPSGSCAICAAGFMRWSTDRMYATGSVQSGMSTLLQPLRHDEEQSLSNTKREVAAQNTKAGSLSGRPMVKRPHVERYSRRGSTRSGRAAHDRRATRSSTIAIRIELAGPTSKREAQAAIQSDEVVMRGAARSRRWNATKVRSFGTGADAAKGNVRALAATRARPAEAHPCGASRPVGG